MGKRCVGGGGRGGFFTCDVHCYRTDLCFVSPFRFLLKLRLSMKIRYRYVISYLIQNHQTCNTSYKRVYEIQDQMESERIEIKRESRITVIRNNKAPNKEGAGVILIAKGGGRRERGESRGEG